MRPRRARDRARRGGARSVARRSSQREIFVPGPAGFPAARTGRRDPCRAACCRTNSARDLGDLMAELAAGPPGARAAEAGLRAVARLALRGRDRLRQRGAARSCCAPARPSASNCARRPVRRDVASRRTAGRSSRSSPGQTAARDPTSSVTCAPPRALEAVGQLDAARAAYAAAIGPLARRTAAATRPGQRRCGARRTGAKRSVDTPRC